MNLVLIEERIFKLGRRHAVDTYATYSAGITGIERCMQLDLRNLLRARGPVVLEIANALFLALAPDTLVEVDRLADALFQREAARAEGFELADVGALRRAVAGERPYLLDLVALDIHHAGADGRREELMQACPEVIAP